MLIRQRNPRFAGRLAAAGLAVLAIAAATGAASAQGIFGSLFGPRPSPPPSATAYADPNVQNPQVNPAPAERPRPSVAYCVRLCDGRYFPIQRHSDANPTELCNSFCPAAHTKVYNGSAIDYAVAKDGTRYSSLANAYVYRDKVVDNCTCNGKDAYGLVTTNANDDPTLRPGDLVATTDGMVAYRGGKKGAADFTPIDSYSGISSDWRRKLAVTKVLPAPPATVVEPIAKSDEATGSVRRAKGRRVQLDR